MSINAVKTPSVLFVCTANVCRSPMAAALLRARLRKEQKDWEDWRVDSAGTWAPDGQSAAKNSCLVMAERGLDINSHRSQAVTAGMLHRYHLILTMEAGHKEALQVEFPRIADRVFLLSEMVGEQGEIDDPYGGPIEAYRATAEKVDQILANGMAKIIELARPKEPKSS